MRCGATSIARFFVRACRPAWAAEQALVGVVSIASTAHIEPTFTIAPPVPRSRIAAAAACDVQNVGRRIEPSASSRCSSVWSRNGTGRKIPVLLTRTSTAPKRSRATRTRSCASSRVVIDPARIAVRAPSGSTSRRASSRTSARVPLRTTFAPSSRNRRAAARPMPPPPPVMRTTLSSNRLLMALLLSSRISADAIGASASIISMQTQQLQAQVFSAAMAELDDEALEAWRAFLTAHAHVTRRISRDLADAGLPDLSWYDLLWALYTTPDRRLRVNELAREVVLSPTAMSRFVDRVEAAGHVRREADPHDRRALRVAITDSGIELLRRMWPVYQHGIERHFAAHLGRSAPRLRAMMRRMADSAR